MHYLSYSQTYYYDLEDTFKILEWRQSIQILIY